MGLPPVAKRAMGQSNACFIVEERASRSSWKGSGVGFGA